MVVSYSMSGCVVIYYFYSHILILLFVWSLDIGIVILVLYGFKL